MIDFTSRSRYSFLCARIECVSIIIITTTSRGERRPEAQDLMCS